MKGGREALFPPYELWGGLFSTVPGTANLFGCSFYFLLYFFPITVLKKTLLTSFPPFPLACSFFKKKITLTLAGVAQWIESQPAN